MTMMNQETVKQQRPIEARLAEVNGVLTQEVSKFLRKETGKPEELVKPIAGIMREILRITNKNKKAVIMKFPTGSTNDEFHMLTIDSTKRRIEFGSLIAFDGKNKGIMIKLEFREGQKISIDKKNHQIENTIKIINSKNKVKEAVKTWELEGWRALALQNSEASPLTELVR